MVPDTDIISRVPDTQSLHAPDSARKSAHTNIARLFQRSLPVHLFNPPSTSTPSSVPTSNASTPRHSTQSPRAMPDTRPPTRPAPKPPLPPQARTSDAAPNPTRINLASMAANALRTKPDLHTVHYIAQVDTDGWMFKRSKVGGKINMYVVLEGTTLSFLKNKSGPPKYVCNVRSDGVHVNVQRRDLVAHIPNREKPLRLHIPSVEEAEKWHHAVASTVESDITDWYSFGKKLGCGSYGDVFEATEVRTKDRRAVKVVQRSSNIKSREHLECEIQVMKSISHPNIVKTFQIFDLKRTIYIVMEYMPGGDLFDFVAQHESLTEAQGSQIMRSIFLAVEYLHCHSIVHRDLKPENILCVNNSWPLEVKVSDFGFSNFMDPAKNDDNTLRTQVGTAYFMAPEIISNKGHGPAVDSWACGVILYTILTGRLPFPGRNTKEYFYNVVNGDPLFPAVLWKGISADAMRLVKGLLNKEPKKRLTSLGALQHNWVGSPSGNEIRRDRSNLHSDRRKLFKARKAAIAVAMAHKFKATIPQMVDIMGEGVKKTADAIEDGMKKTANGIGEGVKKTATGIGEGVKKTADAIEGGVKKTADAIEEGVKKTADGIGEGVKKTADGIGEGVKKTASGVKKVGDGIGEGTKKIAGDIGDGTKKVATGIAEGSKKVAGGIGTGVTKTVHGVETGAKKMGDGVKKTTEGLEKGVKKTVDGFEKGVKKTGDGLKKGVDIVMHLDRERSATDGEGSQMQGSNSFSQSTRDTHRRRGLFRRRGLQSRSSATSTSELVRQQEVPVVTPAQPSVPDASPMRKNSKERTSSDFNSAKEEHDENEEGWSKQSQPAVVSHVSQVSAADEDAQADSGPGPVMADVETVPLGNATNERGKGSKESEHSSGGFQTAVEDHSETEEGWSKDIERDMVGKASLITQPSAARTNTPMHDEPKGRLNVVLEDMERTAIDSGANSKPVPHHSNSSAGTSRPKLPLLSGLTMGLSDECMQTRPNRDTIAGGNR